MKENRIGRFWDKMKKIKVKDTRKNRYIGFWEYWLWENKNKIKLEVLKIGNNILKNLKS